MTLILVPVVVLIAVSFFISFRSAAAMKKTVVLGVSLPREAQHDPGVLELIERYKRANLQLFLVTLAGGVVVILPSAVSTVLLLMTVWIGLALAGGNLLFRSYSRQLLELRSREGWEQGDSDVIRVDLFVSREKQKMPVSGLWFIPPLLVAMGLLVWGHSRGSYIAAALACGETLLFYLLWVLAAKERAQAYSEDTEVNLAITRLSIRGWTFCWAVLANVHSLLLLSVVLLFSQAEADGLGTFAVLAPVLTLAAIFTTAAYIRGRQNQVLSGEDAVFTANQTRYWRGGVYNNPHDQRIFVEKRIGYGLTINIGHKVGRRIFYGSMAAVGVLLLAMFLLFFAFEQAEYSLEIAEGQVVVKAPLYGFSFPAEEIESVSLAERLPARSRTNGAETGSYALGNYSLSGYGQAKLYIYKNKPPYIVIELPDLYVFLNGKTVEQTEHYFQALQELAP